MSTIKSKRTNKPIDVEGTFLKIRDIINEVEFNPEGEAPYNSDELDTMLSTFGTLMDALFYWYCEQGGDAYMPDRTFRALVENWLKLNNMIEVREREYDRVCKLAMHGTEDIFGASTQNGKQKTLDESFKKFMDDLKELREVDRNRANAYTDRLLDNLQSSNGEEK